METNAIGSEIRTTKEGYEIISPLLDLMGIQYEMEISGSARLIRCEYEPDLIKKKLTMVKKSNAGRKEKCSLTQAQMKRELKQIGMNGVCEKYGISERTVYRKLKKDD